MTEEQILFIKIGERLQIAEQSQLFGKPCFKINGKAFICFFENEMVFKLKCEYHIEALRLEGSKLFDPSDKKRPMKEWVQVSSQFMDKWESYAKAAMNYVAGDTLA